MKQFNDYDKLCESVVSKTGDIFIGSIYQYNGESWIQTESRLYLRRITKKRKPTKRKGK